MLYAHTSIHMDSVILLLYLIIVFFLGTVDSLCLVVLCIIGSLRCCYERILMVFFSGNELVEEGNQQQQPKMNEFFSVQFIEVTHIFPPDIPRFYRKIPFKNFSYDFVCSLNYIEKFFISDKAEASYLFHQNENE